MYTYTHITSIPIFKGIGNIGMEKTRYVILIFVIIKGIFFIIKQIIRLIITYFHIALDADRNIYGRIKK